MPASVHRLWSRATSFFANSKKQQQQKADQKAPDDMFHEKLTPEQIARVRSLLRLQRQSGRAPAPIVISTTLML